MSVPASRFIAVFDTNIYRGESPRLFEDLVEPQAAAGVVACANFFTIMELSAHLADVNDEGRSSCYRALQKLWKHCSEETPSGRALRVAGDSDAQVALSLFGTTIVTRQLETDLVSHIVGTIAAAELDGLPGWVMAQIERLRDHRDDIEGRFTNDMLEVVKLIDPVATGWQPYPGDAQKRNDALRHARAENHLDAFAAAIVSRAADNAGADNPVRR